MLNFFKSKKSDIVSPLTGECVSVTQVEDVVFKDKILGDGIAVIPTSGDVFAPVTGTVVQVAHTKHAICFTSEDELEILVHLGFDTVGLNGEGFKIDVEVGQAVKAGEKIGTMDLEFIKSKGLSVISPCIIINHDTLKEFDIIAGNVTGGKDPVIKYIKK